MTSPDHNRFDVSDHAIVRYLERTGRIDMKALRREILSDRTVELAKVLGDGRYPIPNGCLAVIKSKTVVTVLVNGGEENRS